MSNDVSDEPEKTEYWFTGSGAIVHHYDDGTVSMEDFRSTPAERCSICVGIASRFEQRDGVWFAVCNLDHEWPLDPNTSRDA